MTAEAQGPCTGRGRIQAELRREAKARRPLSILQGGGAWTLVEAVRRLLASALLDHGNERFVLLSETCILRPQLHRRAYPSNIT